MCSAVHENRHMPPQMRATHLKENLDAIEKLRPDAAPRVFARAQDTVDLIRGALRTSWLDAEHDVALTEALGAELGMDGVRAVNEEALRRALETPLLKSLWDGAVKLFGLSPAGILRWSPQFWSQLYRDCGTLAYHPEAHALRAENLPPWMAASGAWRVGLAGAVDAVLAMCGQQGRVVAVQTGPGDVEFRLPRAS